MNPIQQPTNQPNLTRGEPCGLIGVRHLFHVLFIPYLQNYYYWPHDSLSGGPHFVCLPRFSNKKKNRESARSLSLSLRRLVYQNILHCQLFRNSNGGSVIVKWLMRNGFFFSLLDNERFLILFDFFFLFCVWIWMVFFFLESVVVAELHKNGYYYIINKNKNKEVIWWRL